jgi:hypothetical protein
MLPQLDLFAVHVLAYLPEAFGQLALLAPLRFVFSPSCSDISENGLEWQESYWS